MVNYPDADGIFMDISFQLPSISSSAKTKMDALGLDWTDARDRDIFTELSVENYFTRVRDAVHKHNPKMPLFFNSGHMRRGLRKHYSDFYSHLELESLPTAGWGYEHFPLSARYVDPLGIPFLGMTGKFHTHWGEVGGYKKPEALVYECGAMLAHGARCSIGDHLHPDRQDRPVDHGHHRARLQMGRRARGLGGRHDQSRRDRPALAGGGEQAEAGRRSRPP